MRDQPGVVMCLECRDVLVSNYVHDFVSCGCKQGTYVDGGRTYMRYGGRDLKKVLPLKLTEYPKRRK